MTAITPEDLKNIVGGEVDVCCDAKEHTEQTPAVAYAKVLHGCPSPHRSWMFMCALHLHNLKAGKVTCRRCLRTIPASVIKML